MPLMGDDSGGGHGRVAGPWRQPVTTCRRLYARHPYPDGWVEPVLAGAAR